MNKKIRILCYSLSFLVLLLIGAAVFKSAMKHNSTSVPDQDASSIKSTAENTTQTKNNQDTTQTAQPKVPAVQATDTSKSTQETSKVQATEATQTTMVFTGDILLGNSVAANYTSKGIKGILSDNLLNQMKSANITMVNEEFPFSNAGSAMQDKQYTFRVNPEYVTAFMEMGIDIVSIANNHTLDYGTQALNDTCATLDKAGILYAGAGATKQRAMQLMTIKENGKTFGFLAASRVLPEGSWNVQNQEPGIFSTYDPTALLAAIKSAKASCDYLTVFVHWGVEKSESPQDYQRSLGKQYMDAGADLVIGSHTHCLEGVEYFDGKPVFYSLGNFLFGNDGQTAAVKVTVNSDNAASYTFLPAKEVSACTSLVTGDEAANIFAHLTQISPNATVGSDGIVQQKAQ